MKGLRKGDDIALDGAVHYGVLGEHVNVAFDGAVDARAVTEQEDVTFDGLVLGDFDSVPLAHFRRRGWWHGHGRDAAHSRQQDRHHGAAAEPLAEIRQGKASDCQHRHDFQQSDHRLPSFPEGALKHQQAHQVGAAESGLIQLGLPGLDVSRIESVYTRRC